MIFSLAVHVPLEHQSNAYLFANHISAKMQPTFHKALEIACFGLGVAAEAMLALQGCGQEAQSNPV